MESWSQYMLVSSHMLLRRGMLSVKVVVGGGGTSWAVNIMELPLLSSSVHVLSPAMHGWVLELLLVGTGAEVRKVVIVLLGDVYNGGGGTTAAV